MSGKTLAVESFGGVAVDEEAVTADDDRRVDAGTLPNHANQVANRGHGAPSKSGAKHNGDDGEVKAKSLEVSCVTR